MTHTPYSRPSIKPIALAEGGSTVVSLGAVWLMQQHPGLIKPMQDYVAQRLVLPTLVSQHHPHTPADYEVLEQQAGERASLLVKGTTMIAAGFASHLPIQLALEGKFHASGLRDAALGKGVGIGVALGSMMTLNKVAPNALPTLQNAIFPLVRPFLPKDDKGRDSRQAAEVAKLLILDIPSSVIAGLINYRWSCKGR